MHNDPPPGPVADTHAHAPVAPVAVKTLHAAINHLHPTFDTVKTVFTFDDGTEVTWKASFNPASTTADTSKYTVEIVKTAPADTTYSLLTLGLQSVDHSLRVSNPQNGGTLEYAVPPRHTALVAFPAAGDAIEPAADPARPGKLDINRIGFLRFTSQSVSLDVIAIGRRIVGSTKWKTVPPNPGTGHDNTPPVDPPA